jgi:D-3-phosphoglycerate dehydrogenase / 2-oxoglutarate reductase
MGTFKTVLIAIGEDPKRGIHTGAQELPEWVIQHLEDHGIDNEYHPCYTGKDLEKYASDADVVWMFSGSRILTAETIPLLKRCGAILKVGSGVDNIDVETATRLGIIVVNTPEAVVGPVAEHTIALLFAAVRNIIRQNHWGKNGRWEGHEARPIHDLEGSTLGLIGFGRIAQLVVGKLAAFEMDFVAYDPFVNTAEIEAHGVRPVSLDELLRKSDFVSIHCNLTPQTTAIIGERELRLMKKHAILVNTARGPIVDEKALYKALSEGWIAAAALDVMDREPPAPDSALLGLENMIITPHVGGMSGDWPDRSWRALCRALVAMSQGRWPDSVVNRQVVRPRAKWLKSEG